MRLKDKVAIITGGASGIGLACAYRFAAEGANVVLADIDSDRGANAESAVSKDSAGKGGGEAAYVACDVGDADDVAALVVKTLGLFERVDILVNNAGTTHSADFLEVREEDFDRVMRVNLKGAFLCGRAVAKQMVSQGGGGAIVNMSSVNALFAISNQVPYSVSKGGMNGLTKVMALSLAPHGIRVNGIGPGSIMTPILSSVMTDDTAKRKILSRTPMGRIGDPGEVANVAAFLAGDEASYMTGQTVYVDGGRLPLNYTVPVPD